MARKPKAAAVADVAQTTAGADLAVPADAPAPGRRGRKPKAAAAPPPPATTVDNGHAADGDRPVRARPGRKPKRPADDAPTPLRDNGQEQRDAKADQPEAVQPLADEGAALIAEGDVHDAAAGGGGGSGGVEGGGVLSGDVDPDGSAGDALPFSSGPDAANRAKPAAHWNRETDTVGFDWPEIERTASQAGPNQVMAKLLVAARAEGANSRWPL